MTRQTLFSPADDCVAPLLAAIGTARHRIRMAMYSYDLPAVTDALIAAHGRGVDVHAVFDLGSSTYPPMAAELKRLAAANVPFVVGTSPRKFILHSKYVVVDGLWTWRGSYNLSKAAALESNHVDIDHGAVIAARYETDWALTFNWIVQNVPQPAGGD